MDTDMLDAGRALLAQQALSLLLGAELDVFELGRAQMKMAYCSTRDRVGVSGPT